ncbi:MAG: 6-bladed beta-propeller [Saprospiraceae bacterium]|nr:6-bladed beta-propeller [Saprospiraceae bacterium]
MKIDEIHRRQFVKSSVILGAGTSVSPFFIGKMFSGEQKEIIGHGDFRYRVHKHWGDLAPSKNPVKNCHEMVMDSQGRLIMVGDETKNNVLIYDKSGRLLDYWGIRYTGGHGLSLWDAGGEEFLFICDTSGSVIKTTLEGRELQIIGHPSTYGAYAEDDPWSPTETAIGPNGDLYVADGYGSCYVLQFSNEGEFIRKIGGGRGDEQDQFQTAHGVCVDTRDAENPTLLITSRAHNCFKRFTLDGMYLESLCFPGAFVCRPVIDDKNLYAGVCWSSATKFIAGQSDTHPYNNNPNSGFVMICDQNNRVVSNPGGTEPKYIGGQLQTMLQDQPVFHHCHDVCIDGDKNIYVCQWNAEKSYPIKLERI